jgi:hypothetical protein
MWGIWAYRDLTLGDTASYFQSAVRWATDLQILIHWSPLYTSFLGTLYGLLDDAFWAVTIHHLVIVVVASVLVLTIFRRILPHSLAWLLTIWWVILPINFDTFYGVHLFSAMVIFFAFAVIAYVPSIWGRGAGVGLFLAITALVRNEFSTTLGLWVIVCAAYEVYLRRKGIGISIPYKVYLAAYGIPILVALGLIGFFYSRSVIKYPELSISMEEKHTLNICQIYAFNRQQQGDAWQGSPWTECQNIMMRDFGEPQPSFTRAFSLNSSAMLGHLEWNARLIPAGMQLALFNAYSGEVNPDYAPAKRLDWVWVPFGVLLLIIATGLFQLWRDRDEWRKKILERAAFVWVAMLCTGLTTILVMVMQRPRPSYMFSFTLFVMVLTGLSAWVLLEKYRLIAYLTRLAPIVGLISLLAIPPYYTSSYDNFSRSKGQWARHAYEDAKPFLSELANSNMPTPPMILMPAAPHLLCSYLRGFYPCTGMDYRTLYNTKPDDIPYSVYLRQNGVNWVYLNSHFLGQAEVAHIQLDLLSGGWQIVASSTALPEPFVLLNDPVGMANFSAGNDGIVLNPPLVTGTDLEIGSENPIIPPVDTNPDSSITTLSPDNASIIVRPPGKSIQADFASIEGQNPYPEDGVFVGTGWYPIETTNEGQPLRWAEAQPTFVVTNPTSEAGRLLMDISPGPSMADDLPVEIEMRTEDGELISTIDLSEHSVVVVDLPLQTGVVNIFQMMVTNSQGKAASSQDSRVLDFRLHEIQFSPDQ